MQTDDSDVIWGFCEAKRTWFHGWICKSHKNPWPCSHIPTWVWRRLLRHLDKNYCLDCLGEGGESVAAMPDAMWIPCKTCKGCRPRITLEDKFKVAEMARCYLRRKTF